MDKLSLMLEHSVDFSSVGLKNNGTSEKTEGKNSFEDLIRKAADKIKDAVNPNTQRTDETKSEVKAEAKVEAGADEDGQAKLELAASLVTRQPIAFVDVAADTGVSLSKDGIQVDVKADLSVLPQNLVKTNVDVGVQVGRNGIQFNVNAQAQAGVEQVQQITQEQVTDTVVQDATVQPTDVEATVIPVQTNDSAQSSQTDDAMAQTDSNPVEVSVENETKQTESPEEAVENQLFEEVDVVPVKVGEATDAQQTTATVDIESPEAEQQIGETVSEAIENGQESVLVKLNPRNLGEMTVEISKANDGTIGVLLKATSQKTVTILQQHLNGLEMQLLHSTHSEVKVEVQSGSESQQTENQMNPDGRNGSNAQKNPHRNPEHRAEETRAQDFIQQLRLGLVGMEAAV